jgi:dihydrofolate reductase
MSRVTADLAISVDGFSAGPNQTAEKPFGDGPVDELHRWMFEEPEEHAEVIAGFNTAAAIRLGLVGPAAYIMGRNMFTPGRGEWDLGWKGWWGDDPPYRAPVFVLTHHPREPLTMEGGTTFTFVTDGTEAALAQARAAAGDGQVCIAGGAATVRQYLAAGLLDELRLHVAPVLLGSGERPLEGLTGLELEPLEVSSTKLVTHLGYRVARSDTLSTS